jgi:hypothetical protein
MSRVRSTLRHPNVADLLLFLFGNGFGNTRGPRPREASTSRQLPSLSHVPAEREGHMDDRVKIIRGGLTRTVILIGPFAIKVPTFRYGLPMWCRGVLANQSEREWSSVDGVNPVLWSLWSLVNVYRRAQPVGPEWVGRKHDRYDATRYDALTPGFMPAGDRQPGNLGIVRGRVVWVDYDSSWNGPRCPTCAADNAVNRPHTLCSVCWGRGVLFEGNPSQETAKECFGCSGTGRTP